MYKIVRMFFENKIVIIILLFALGYMLVLCRYGIDIDDEGLHLYFSKQIAEGFVPYRDFSLVTTPLSFYVQGLIFRVFGSTVLVGRFSMVALGLYIIFVLFCITGKLVVSKYMAAISPLVFIFWGVMQIRHPWYGWYGLASALTFLFFALRYVETENILFLFIAGLFTSLTFLVKQNLGVAVIISYVIFLILNKFLLSRPVDMRRRLWIFIKEIVVLMSGAALPMAIALLYFYRAGALERFAYFIFKFAISAADKKFIFNPFPHLKIATLFILFIILASAFLLYKSFWGRHKKPCLILFYLILLALIAGFSYFIYRIDEVDSLYILDHLKTGMVNGFFNLPVLSIIAAIFVSLKEIFERKDFTDYHRKILLTASFALFYIWSALCVSRDHLHLVLAIPASYPLMAFLFDRGRKGMESRLVAGGKDKLVAGKYALLSVVIMPLLFIFFAGFFTTLKNEGFRSVSPSILKMDSKLEIGNASGIIVSEEDKQMITEMVEYIWENTETDEKIFDTYKSLLFYFIADRQHAAYYNILHYDYFRPDKQDYVIDDIKKNNIRLVISEKIKWDRRSYYMDHKNNPLSFKIWRYVVDNYGEEKDFRKYYILERKDSDG